MSILTDPLTRGFAYSNLSKSGYMRTDNICIDEMIFQIIANNPTQKSDPTRKNGVHGNSNPQQKKRRGESWPLARSTPPFTF